MILRETIHHGDEFQVIDHEIPAFNPDTLNEVIAASPYRYAARYPDKWVAVLHTDLTLTGKGSHGWSRYELLQSEAKVYPCGHRVTSILTTPECRARCFN